MRLLGSIALLLMLVAAPFACVQVIGADGYLGAASSLCELLAQCYTEARFPGCESRAAAALESTDPDTRAKFLAAFGAEECLLNCSNAEDCLDLRPLCEDIGAACEQLEHCCGFNGNAAACGDGRCCLQDGQSCTGDGQCCTVCDLHTETCGGKPPCGNQGEACQIDADCCSNNCDDGTCSFVCRDIGEDCATANDCCSDHCDNLKCACKPGGESCTFHDQCCEGFCDPREQRCVDAPDCAVFGASCGDGLACCQGLACGDTSQQCCYPPGNACPADPASCCGGDCNSGLCCTPPGSACSQPDECCAGSCIDDTCQCSPLGAACDADRDCCNAVCRPNMGCVCNAPGCHSGCKTNAKPLSLVTDNCTTMPALKVDCLQAVCDQDPFCCCVAWDDACVGLVQTLADCGGNCVDAISN